MSKPFLALVLVALFLAGASSAQSSQSPFDQGDERQNVAAFRKAIEDERKRPNGCQGFTAKQQQTEEKAIEKAGGEKRSEDQQTNGRDETKKESLEKLRLPAGERILTAFPFVTVAEFSGESSVPYFRSKDGKLSADHRSTIRVCFDPVTLAEDPVYSQGDLSLAAQIGDRAVSVEGYAEIGKTYEKFKPAAVRPVTYAISYATIQSRASEAQKAFTSGDDLGGINRARTISEIFGTLLDGAQISYITARITDTSEPDLKTRQKALRDALKSYDTVNRDSKFDPEQVEAEIVEARRKLKTAEDELLDAAIRQAEVLADVNADAKKKEATRLQADQLGALAVRRGTELKELETRQRNAQGGSALLAQATRRVGVALADIAALFLLDSKKGGARIYQETTNLREGQIFLRKEDAKPGDLLRISLLHFPPDYGTASDEQTAKTPVAETLAEISIDNYGWRSEIADSFLLVKAKDSELDTSNFKGAAGVSLLYSLNPRHVAGNPLLNTIRAVSPSIGANVSYLDFSEENDIEIGAGLVIGLFSNMIHAGYGWNLNHDGDREYVFLGFSFGKIKDRITGNQPQ